MIARRFMRRVSSADSATCGSIDPTLPWSWAAPARGHRLPHEKVSTTRAARPRSHLREVGSLPDALVPVRPDSGRVAVRGGGVPTPADPAADAAPRVAA